MAKIADQIDVAPTEEQQSYSTETPAEAAAQAAPRPVLNVPGAAVGRRKQAIARVRLVPGAGTITVNGREFADYFPNKLHQQLINDPFKVLDLLGSYDVDRQDLRWWPLGPGRRAAPRHRPRAERDRRENNRATLKKAGFLTRDARVKERKKAGLKKARKAPQFSKR